MREGQRTKTQAQAELRSDAHLSEASFSQNFDEQEVVQVHPLDFRSNVTFDLPVLPVCLVLHFDAASSTSSSTSSFAFMTVPRYRGNR